VVATLETSQGLTEVTDAVPAWILAISRAAENQLPPHHRPPRPSTVEGLAAAGRLAAWLTDWCRAIHPVPAILLLDEADVVTGPAKVNLLRQLRSGFFDRVEFFPSTSRQASDFSQRSGPAPMAP
jgi:hypothetical protein